MLERNINVAKLDEAVCRMQERFGGRRPDTVIVLGSGLGGYMSDAPGSLNLPYDLLGFPKPGVAGHDGTLSLVRIAEREVALCRGRAHFYEGHPLQDVVFVVRTLARAGVRNFIITCASGYVNRSYRPGQLVIIKDHLELTFQSCLRGLNVDQMGPRFPDMGTAYDPEFRKVAQKAAVRSFGARLKEGVYAMMPGPRYETAAEIRMLGKMGADMAGMSTVPEVVALRHMGARTLGISCCTNAGAGVTKAKLHHEEVVQTATRVKGEFSKLLTAILTAMPHDW